MTIEAGIDVDECFQCRSRYKKSNPAMCLFRQRIQSRDIIYCFLASHSLVLQQDPVGYPRNWDFPKLRKISFLYSMKIIYGPMLLLFLRYCRRNGFEDTEHECPKTDKSLMTCFFYAINQDKWASQSPMKQNG